jgi:RimJ/RimL family protein N-acetyltransferase
MMTDGARALTKVRLEPLSEADYAAWLAQSIDGYAAEKVRAGNWAAERARARAEEEFRQLLPGGLTTPGNHLFSIEDAGSGTKVGIVWLAIRDAARGRAFIYDFLIHEQYRRRGYGLAALRALDGVARGLGMQEIGLHVFGHNHAARALYEKAGYEVTNVSMARKLDASAEPPRGPTR